MKLKVGLVVALALLVTLTHYRGVEVLLALAWTFWTGALFYAATTDPYLRS